MIQERAMTFFLGSFLNFCTALCNSEKILIFVYKL